MHSEEYDLALSVSRTAGLRQWNLGYRYEQSYTQKDEATLCVPPPIPEPFTCDRVRIGEPTKKKADFLHLEYRELYVSDRQGAFELFGNRWAIAPRLTWDMDEDIVGIRFPIYLVMGKDKSLTTDLVFGGDSREEELNAAIFIGKAFSLFN